MGLTRIRPGTVVARVASHVTGTILFPFGPCFSPQLLQRPKMHGTSNSVLVDCLELIDLLL